jgi:cytochrome c553
VLRWAYRGWVVGIVGVALVAGCGVGPQSKAQRGAMVFKTCVPCHGEDGRGDLTLRAPAIAGLPEWYVTTELTMFKNDIRGAHPNDNEGMRMRPMARTLYHPGDLEAVSAYVAGLPAVSVKPVLGGDRAAGEKQYTTICIACHGPDGKGNQALGAPPLVRQADWYLVAQLEKFKSGMRGANPQDIQGSQMRAMSSTLQDSTAMHDVVAYIKSLPQ